MYALIKSLLFQLDPEKAHYWAMRRLQFAYKIPFLRRWIKKQFTYENSQLEQEIWGIKFPNPVGLAAGFDKNAKWINELACLGFGFIEIGTVTPLAQPGNPKPRLFRLVKDKALINRMGFNNEGTQTVIENLSKPHKNIIIGGNIGKNKNTPNENAIDDYEKAFMALHPYVDYFVVNVSSPNTPGLRALQDKEPLTKLLNHLMACNQKLNSTKAILLKIAPDLSDSQLDDIIELVQDTKIQGIVATNTTISREHLQSNTTTVEAIGAGGLSGAPLKNRSTEVVRYIHQKTNGAIKIIAAGGIYSAQDAQEKIDAGASLVQVFSGFIYEGPALASQINKNIKLPKNK